MLGFEYDEEEAKQAFIEYGVERGREENKLEMVKNLLMVKTPIKYIVAATGWSKEKILSLAEEN